MAARYAVSAVQSTTLGHGSAVVELRAFDDYVEFGWSVTLKEKGRKIRCYDYVNHPYERVRDALKQNALVVFESATKTAANRARSVAAELRVNFAGIGVKTDIKIDVKSFHETAAGSVSMPTTRLKLEWEAAKMPRLFPLMKGELFMYPLTATETQLDFSGVYKPPFGSLGKAMNAIVGHRIAEASVHSFVSDVAGYLRQALR
jgi:ribosome-associated toxin RatA of RatAB toxin-antitoxin module